MSGCRAALDQLLTDRPLVDGPLRRRCPVVQVAHVEICAPIHQQIHDRRRARHMQRRSPIAPARIHKHWLFVEQATQRGGVAKIRGGMRVNGQSAAQEVVEEFGHHRPTVVVPFFDPQLNVLAV